MGLDKEEDLNSCSNRLWGMESKAFDKSNRIRIVILDSSISYLMSSVKAASAVSVKWPRQYQACLKSSTWVKSWLKTSLSRILDCSGSMAIGLVLEIERWDGVFERGFILNFFQNVRKVEVVKEQLHMELRIEETRGDANLSICWNFIVPRRLGAQIFNG